MDIITILSVVFGTLFVVVFGVWRKYLNYPPTNIPGPKPHWLWGNRYEFSNIEYVHHDFKRLADEYGPLVRLHVPGRMIVVLSDAAEMRQLFNRPLEEVSITPNFQKSMGAVADGLLSLVGDTWKHHRKLLQPAFSPANLKHTVTASNAVCDQLVQEWSKHAAAGEYFDADRDYSNLTLDVIGLVAFAYKFNTIETGSSAVADASMALSMGVRRRVRVPRWTWWMFSDNKAFNEGIKTIHAAVQEVLQARKSGRRDTVAAEASGDAPRDLMDLMLDTQNEANGLSDKEITDETIMFFLAGHETTANTLSWLTYCLATHPEVMQKLQAEVDEVLGGRQPTWEDLPNLKYTEMVIKESLRLYPVAALTSRYPYVPMELCGHSIQPGTIIAVNIIHIHRNPKYWDQPEKFVPERWVDFKPVQGSYLPFGDGPKNCIGQRLAIIELKVVVPRIVQRFSVELQPGFVPDDVLGITMSPRNGMWVKLSARTN